MQDFGKIKKINDLAKSFKDSGLAKDMEEAIKMAEKSLIKGEESITKLTEQHEAKGFFGKLKEKIIPPKEKEITEEDEEKIDEVLKEAGVDEEIRDKVDDIPKEDNVETEEKEELKKEVPDVKEEYEETEDTTEESEEKEKIIRTEEEEAEEE